MVTREAVPSFVPEQTLSMESAIAAIGWADIDAIPHPAGLETAKSILLNHPDPIQKILDYYTNTGKSLETLKGLSQLAGSDRPEKFNRIRQVIMIDSTNGTVEERQEKILKAEKYGIALQALEMLKQIT
ncbi:MAG TPA: hypothetical protein VGT05_03850 [Patescibacteria group bacterium]|nr:hypothetical protein [Patescibacteria group bacterium]